MALHFPVTGNLYGGGGGVTFGDGLMIASSGKLDVLSSAPHSGCSACLWLHGSVMVSALMDSDAVGLDKGPCLWLLGPFL